ncbi:ABC transporter permease [Thermotoga sp. 38H-to]|uniref:ABC transporter permease n=1 Tax=Thermotoga sp. 38H-to TaxID=1755812 RepID=UPI0013EAA424|nr:ABC transporter permease [Thermotoga sp. 38H-to]KAF2959956.1 ABC transporter [Thermotoga sp. 38H-to]
MFGRLLKKEIKELLNLGTIVSVVVMAVLYASLGNVFKSAVEKSNVGQKVAIVREDTGTIAEFAEKALSNIVDIVYAGSDLKEAEEAVKKERASAIIVIPEGFSQSLESGEKARLEIVWYLRGTGLSEAVSTGMISSLIESLKVQLASFVLNDPKKAQLLFNPFEVVQHTYLKGKLFENHSPKEIMNVFYSQNITIPILIMMLIVMSGSSLITSLALEKENKTLETLLTMPVKREHIALAKIVGSAIGGLIFAGIYMAGFYSYLNSLTQDVQGMGLNFKTVDFLLMGLSLFLSILAGLSLCMLLGMMAKNESSAQLLTFPISILALVPMIANMIMDFSNLPGILKVIVFLIPFSHPIMSPKLTFYGEYGLILSGILYLLIFSVVTTIFVFRIFNSDYIVLGWQGEKSLKFFSR